MIEKIVQTAKHAVKAIVLNVRARVWSPFDTGDPIGISNSVNDGAFSGLRRAASERRRRFFDPDQAPVIARQKTTQIDQEHCVGRSLSKPHATIRNHPVDKYQSIGYKKIGPAREGPRVVFEAIAGDIRGLQLFEGVADATLLTPMRAG